MDVANTSGQGRASQVPPEIRRWNWGAFTLNWIWGIGNNTLASLATLVPLFGLFWLFVLGAKGSEWAWRNKRWDSIEHFKATQRQWAKWGAIVWLGTVAALGLVFLFVFVVLKDAEAYKLAQARLQADERVAEIVGRPMATGYPLGSLQVSGESGGASLSFSVKGPRGGGQAFVTAHMSLGEWQIDHLIFTPDGSDERIELVTPLRDSKPEAGT
jgi:hypothetical protein